MVVDSASLEVNRRLRRTKTDRIDAGKLVSMLVRYHGGEQHLWRVVRVPSREDEDARHLHRDLEALKRERTRYRNWIHGILNQQGLRIKNPGTKKFVQALELMRTWDGWELPPEMKMRIVRVAGGTMDVGRLKVEVWGDKRLGLTRPTATVGLPALDF